MAFKSGKNRFPLFKDKATVIKSIYPGKEGRVHYQGTDWFAVCPIPGIIILRGTVVPVLRRENLTLYVSINMFDERGNRIL